MNIKRISIFSMLIIVSTVTLTICLPNSVAQDYTRINLPEGAKARLGKGAIFEIAYLPDGKRLTVGSSLGLWIYDAHSGEELALYSHQDSHQDSHQNNSQVISYSLSPDERTLASGGVDRTVRLWDVETRTLKHTFTGHSGWVYSVSFSPDGKTIASASQDATVLLWDALTDAPVPEELTEDINGDGVVNIQDLVRVASRIGEDVPTGGDPADVNGDGVINIQDLVQVAGALGN